MTYFKETVEAGERAVAEAEALLEENEGWHMCAVDVDTLDSLLGYIKELKEAARG